MNPESTENHPNPVNPHNTPLHTAVNALIQALTAGVAPVPLEQALRVVLAQGLRVDLKSVNPNLLLQLLIAVEGGPLPEPREVPAPLGRTITAELRKTIRAFAMVVAEEGIKSGSGDTRAVPADKCREVVDSVLTSAVEADIAIQTHALPLNAETIYRARILELEEDLEAARAKQASPLSDAIETTMPRMCSLKTTDLVSRGFKATGYILTSPDGKQIALSDSSVRWLSQPQYWRLMHEQDGSLFNTPATAQAQVASLTSTIKLALEDLAKNRKPLACALLEKVLRDVEKATPSSVGTPDKTS